MYSQMTFYWERWRDTAAPRSYFAFGCSDGVQGSLQFFAFGLLSWFLWITPVHLDGTWTCSQLAFQKAALRQTWTAQMRAEVCFACAATNRLQQRFAWKWCRQLPEAHAAMKEKRSLRAHVTWSIQGKHSCISLSSVFSCVWDIVLGCRLLCNSLPQKSEFGPKIRPKWFKIHDMWRPGVLFCSILAAMSFLETT